MDCVDAWEEQKNGCTVKYNATCGQAINSTDAICQCRPKTQLGAPPSLMSWQDLAATSLETAGQKPSCFNPLYKIHWAGKSDIRHLDSKPHVQQGLQLCPTYNGMQGCCLNSFEHVLDVAFQRWVTHWKRRSQNLQSFQVQMAKVKVSQSYVKADKLQRALFDKAMTSSSV